MSTSRRHKINFQLAITYYVMVQTKDFAYFHAEDLKLKLQSLLYSIAKRKAQFLTTVLCFRYNPKHSQFRYFTYKQVKMVEVGVVCKS